MRIQHNIMAMNAYRNYNTNTSALSKNLEKLSSGYKINRAGDDAAGLAISEKMRAQITGLNAAQKNVKDGISLVKTAEGAMQEIQDMLNRMDYLATQSANGTYDDPVDRKNLQKEVDALKSEINRIADSANFNGIKLLDGSQAESGGSTVSVTGSVTSTVTAGQAGGGGAITLTDAANFKATTANGVHPGTTMVDQATVAFTIDLAGLAATASANGDSISLKLGNNVLATFSVTTGAGALNAGQIATGLQDALSAGITIGGVKFDVTLNGTDKLDFKLAAGQTYTASAADDINALLGSQVEFVEGADMEITSPAAEHGIVDITYAQAKIDGNLAGIDFTITDNLIANGNQLKIGDTTFVLQTDANSTPDITGMTGASVLDISGVSSDKWAAEIMRKLTTTGSTITHTRDDGTSVTFNISSTGPNTIHLDQVAPATGTAPVYSEDDLKGLFSAAYANTAPVTGSLELAPSISADVAEGDRLSFGDGKTYVIAAAGSDKLTADIAAAQADEKVTEIYVTADDFNTELNKFVTKKAAEAGIAAPSASGADKYAISIGADGKATITAKDAADVGTVDHPDKLAAIQAAAEAFVNNFTVNKLTEGDVGGSGLKLQIGDTSDSFNQLAVKIGDMHTNAMGTMEAVVAGGKETPVAGKSIADIDISNPEGAHDAIDVIKNAINYVSGIRGDLGATQNRLEHTANNLSVMAENIQDAESTIRDTDVAEEMMAYTKNNILVQSAQAMLAQANAVPQGVLQLLG